MRFSPRYKIVQVFRNGPRTEARLCRELNLDDKAVAGYVSYLRSVKKVKLSQTKRGDTLVKIIGLPVLPQPKPTEVKVLKGKSSGRKKKILASA